MDVDSRNVARLKGVTMVCGDFADTYAVNEHQKVREIDKGTMGLGIGLMLGGGALVGLTSVLPREASPVVPILGGVAMVGGMVGMFSALFGMSEYERDVVAEDPEVVTDNRCEEHPLTVAASLPWQVETGGDIRKGSTPPSGELDLKPLIAQAPSADRVQRGKSLRMGVTLGTAPPLDLELAPRDIHEDVWTQWSAAFASKLDAESRLQFVACGAAAGSGHLQFECAFTPEKYAKRMLPLETTLKPISDGAFAAIVANVPKKRGERLTHVVLLPSKDPLVLVRVVKREDGAVVAESAATNGTVHSISASLSEDGDYAVAIAAGSPLKLKSILVDPSAEVTE